ARAGASVNPLTPRKVGAQHAAPLHPHSLARRTQGEPMRPFRIPFGLAALLGAWLVAPGWLAAQSAPQADTAAKQADTTGKHSDPAPAAVNHLETTLAGFKLSGFAEASYAYSGRSDGDTIVGRLYDRFQNHFMLNALAVVLDRPYDPAKLSAGFHTEL